MPNVYLLPAVPECSDITPRQPYSFDMTQPDANGLVLIDACVPYHMAVEFMSLLALYAAKAHGLTL